MSARSTMTEAGTVFHSSGVVDRSRTHRQGDARPSRVLSRAAPLFLNETRTIVRLARDFAFFH